MIGYLISSHVAQNHVIIPPLLSDLTEQGIAPERILVVVNGATTPHCLTVRGVRFVFQQPDFASHFEPATEQEGFSHWFFINGTSRCGPRFRELVESGFDPEADCTRAGGLLILGKRGRTGRLINDLGMYRHDYLCRRLDIIREATETNHTQHGIEEVEGVLFALAERQAEYPITHHTVDGPSDVYGTGTPRITEHYPGINWYRYKKNWGQLRAGTYNAAQL
jgi:hypothetical protein